MEGTEVTRPVKFNQHVQNQRSASEQKYFLIFRQCLNTSILAPKCNFRMRCQRRGIPVLFRFDKSAGMALFQPNHNQICWESRTACLQITPYHHHKVSSTFGPRVPEQGACSHPTCSHFSYEEKTPCFLQAEPVAKHINRIEFCQEVLGFS